MIKKMEKEKNIMIMVYYNMRENIKMIINGMEKDMIEIKILYMN